MLLFFLSIFALTLALTIVLEKYAYRLCLIDYPIARSAHTSPKPSGGGLVVAVLFLFVSYVLDVNDYIPSNVFYSLLAAVPVAAQGTPMCSLQLL